MFKQLGSLAKKVYGGINRGLDKVAGFFDRMDEPRNFKTTVVKHPEQNEHALANSAAQTFANRYITHLRQNIPGIHKQLPHTLQVGFGNKQESSFNHGGTQGLGRITMDMKDYLKMPQGQRAKALKSDIRRHIHGLLYSGMDDRIKSKIDPESHHKVMIQRVLKRQKEMQGIK